LFFFVRVSPAEQLPMVADGSVDLLMVVEALHWFNLPDFWAEVDRVMRPGGVVAVLG
jgi:ubiquinone/menaquinone biosynthesis C-methylase UbiE